MDKIKEVTFGNICLWNFDLLKDTKIHNEQLKNQIEKVIYSNIEHCAGKPMKGVGVISYTNNNDFQPFNKKQLKEIYDFKKILFLVSSAESNIHNSTSAGHLMVTSENFTLVNQSFQLDNNNTAYRTGGIVSVRAGGYELGKIDYAMPRYVLDRNLSYDEDLLNALINVQLRKKRVYERILRAVDSMMNGFRNSDDVSNESRILEQARAFEILFQLPDGSGQREEFKNKIGRYCSLNNEKVIKYTYKYKKRNGDEVTVSDYATRQIIWADRFYMLRNKIIHGDNISPKDYSYYGNHIHLGLMFFLVSIKQIINIELKKKIFYDTIVFRKSEIDKKYRLEYDRKHLHKILYSLRSD